MTFVELGDFKIRVLDSVQVQFILTREQYLESFKVTGRIDLDLAVDADLCSDVLDRRTPTSRVGPRPTLRSSDSSIAFGFMGLNREPRRRTVGDREFLEHRDLDDEKFTKVEGLPESGVIRFEADLSNAELEDLAKSSDRYRVSHNYTTESPPLELIPIRLSGRFVRDYEEFRRARQQNVEEEHVGKSSLTLEVTNTTLERPVDIEDLRISFAETYPRVSWSPRKYGQLLPERRELVFSGVRIDPEQSQNFDIVANLESVLQLGVVKGQLRAEIRSYTISGVSVDRFFLPNGFPLSSGRRDAEQMTRVMANIELDPKAMEEELLRSQTVVFDIDEHPRDVFDRTLRFLEASGHLLPSARSYGKPEPDHLRQNIWHESHRIDGVRKVFEDAVVRLSADVDGEWGEVTEEHEIESGGTRTEKGRKSTYGRTKVTVIAQSAHQTRMSQCLEEITEFFRRTGG